MPDFNSRRSLLAIAALAALIWTASDLRPAAEQGASIPELGQSFDRGLVRLEIEPPDQNLDWVGRRVLRLGVGRLADNRGNDRQTTGPKCVHRFLPSAGFEIIAA